MVSDKLKNKAALMLGIGEPVGIVSQQLGVSRQSLYNWRSESAFQEMERTASRALSEFKNFVTQEVSFARE